MKINEEYLKKMALIKIDNPRKLVAICIVIFMIQFVIIILLYSFSPISVSLSLCDIVMGAIIGGVVFFINLVFTYIIHYKNSKKTNYAHRELLTAIDYLFTTMPLRLIVIFLAATIEEYIFRSYILSFTYSFLPLGLAVTINAIAFYLAHSNSKVVELMLMAVIFSLITIYTGNILSAIVAHTVNNMLAYYFKKYYLKKIQ